MAHVVRRGQVTGPRRLGLLPAEASTFVGRASELAAIAALLDTARMVTVVGPAGVGKTRVSLRAATAAADQFPDGVWLADLAEVSEPGLLALTVAAALGLPDQPGGTARGPLVHGAVLGHLRGRKLLLILDTCEHLVDACAAFADTVLRAAPEVTLLATSRQPLDVPGEHAFPLLPLPAAAAVELFAQRAAAVVPEFTVTAENRNVVAAVCQRLDRLPLALEFAAVRLRALPLAELARQLESGIRTLTVSRRGTSPRHQTLRAAVAWSHELCTPAERTLWERLSVFADTFDVGGAEQVCADDRLPREQVVHALVGLVDKSVVLRDGTDPARYRLLAGMREFGADMLADSGERERFRGQLAVRSLAVARDFDEWYRGGARPGGGEGDPGGGAGEHGTGGQAAALRALRREYANIREALGYALNSGDPADAADLTRWRLGADLAVRLSC
ncbi:MAG TPA: AAA family ATPase [Trebonia sp.]|nr:AAA family ATPase [Trebonia sp.]